MKKRFRWLFALLAICMVISMLPLQAMAASETYQDEYGLWTYEVAEDGSITITGFRSAQKNIVVPAKINGKFVRKLGDGLFKNRADLTMIVVPYGITDIGNDVFSGCAKLEKVELPQSLTTIGDKAFANCEKLEQLFIPSSVTELGEEVFKDSPKIEVRCDKDSATAEYLKQNKDDVSSFTLIEVTPSPATKPPVTNGSTSTPDTAVTVKGKLVTYEFGKTINGKREYTIVLADTDPNMDVLRYLKQHDHGYQSLDTQIYEALRSRFQLVSLTRYDGKNTMDITPKSGEGIVGTRAWIQSEPDGDHTKHDVLYGLSIRIDNLDEDSLDLVEFDSKTI